MAEHTGPMLVYMGTFSQKQSLQIFNEALK